jgi:hypothetical protein
MKPLEPSSMDVEKILAQLKAEREQMEQVLVSLEQLAHGRGRKRGKPPAWMAEVTSPTGPWPPDPPLPPGAAMPVPRAAADLVWAVSGRKRPAS